MNNNILYGVAGLLVGIIIGIFIAPPVMLPNGSMGMVWGDNGNSSMSETIDRHFIEEMIPHHNGAIAMAELALERSKRPDILSLAEGIIEAQTRENSEMRTWYEDWFGTQVPIESTPSGMGMMDRGGMYMISAEGDLEELRSAEDFDLEFIRQMIPHHEMAIMMARMLAAGSGREEMQKLADQIITSQSREIDMMRSW